MNVQFQFSVKKQSSHFEIPKENKLEQLLAQEFRYCSRNAFEILEEMLRQFGALVIDPSAQPELAFKNGVEKIYISNPDKNPKVFDHEHPATHRLKHAHKTKKLEFKMEWTTNQGDVLISLSNLKNAMRICSDNGWPVAFDPNAITTAQIAINNKNPDKIYAASCEFRDQVYRFQNAMIGRENPSNSIPTNNQVERVVAEIKPDGREACVLQAMLEKGINTTGKRQTQQDIVNLAFGNTSSANSYRAVFRKLKKQLCVETGSNGIGLYLTDLGKQTAENLSSSANPKRHQSATKAPPTK